VEVSPPLENGQLTALNAAYVFFEILCLVAEAHAQH
jgi:arginase family enzyme